MASGSGGSPKALSGKAMQDYVLARIREKRAGGEELTSDEVEMELLLLRRHSTRLPLNKRVVEQMREPSSDVIRAARDTVVSAITAYLRAIAPDSRNGSQVILRGTIRRNSTGFADFHFEPRLKEVTRRVGVKRGVK